MRICCSLFVPRSFAVTLRMPFASMSNATSIRGTPRGADGMPASWNLPSVRLSRAIGRSPWRTWTSTAGWLSAAVEKTSFFWVGIVVLRGMRTAMSPPWTSTPRESGVTSSRTMSWTPSSWLRIAPCTAAPSATASSGFTLLFGSRPKSSFTSDCTFGMRVLPPTRITSSICFGSSFASRRACRHGCLQRSIRWSTTCSNFARVMDFVRCFGPVASIVMYGRLMSVATALESSHFAFSAASFRRWSAIWSLRRSIPLSRWNSSATWLMSTWSKSSPPRCVSPLVESTSKTPSAIWRIDTSNVPPPRSNTTIFFSCFSLFSPYASAAAVGSFTMRRTLRPAMRPASFVAWRCESLKYAGTVMTASVTSPPR
ncbi:MAG: hypothetical protein HMLKMBBP_02593 [Planctomycetes bacterium]|nr:hypothetical protein [Planctomycetota bacterium]